MRRIIANINNIFIKHCTIQRVEQQIMSYYAVAAGREVGIFQTWALCEKNVKGYSNPKYKKFKTKAEAEAFIKINGVDVKSKAQTFDPRNSAVCLSHKATGSKTKKDLATSKRTNEEVKPSVEEKWPDEFECDAADNDMLLAAAAEVEGMEEGTNSRKRQLTETSSSVPEKSAKYTHESKVWEAIGLKKIGDFEFPIDSEGYVIVYTDGSCINNGKKNAIAGYGVYFSENHALNTAKPVKGRVTNNAGEIQAAIHAIQLARDFGIKKLCISTDSQFLINAVTCWMDGWKRKGWKLGTGKPVKNADDFSTLDELLDGSVVVKWNYVKGHKGIEGNERADQLARKGAEEFGRCNKNK